VVINQVAMHLILTFCLNQGGDLIKWDKAKIGYYVGIDIADGSVSSCWMNTCFGLFVLAATASQSSLSASYFTCLIICMAS